MKKLLYLPTITCIMFLLVSCKNSDQHSNNTEKVIQVEESLAGNKNDITTDHEIINGLTPAERLSDRKSIINNLRRIASYVLKGNLVNLHTLHYYCGLPDGYRRAKADESGDTFIYYYDREDTAEKHVAYVLVDDGELQKVGFNRASVNDHSGFKKVKLSDMINMDNKSQ